MDLNTVHKNFDTKEEFEKMLKKYQPIDINKAVDILGYLIAKDKDDYTESLFNAIEDDNVKRLLLTAVEKLDDVNIKSKKTYKTIVGTSSDVLTDIITGDDAEDWDESEDDDFDFKI